MRTYEVYYNANKGRFQPADYQVIGTVLAKNKEEAVREMKAALHGRENSATVFIENVATMKNLKAKVCS